MHVIIGRKCRGMLGSVVPFIDKKQNKTKQKVGQCGSACFLVGQPSNERLHTGCVYMSVEASNYRLLLLLLLFDQRKGFFTKDELKNDDEFLTVAVDLENIQLTHPDAVCRHEDTL